MSTDSVRPETLAGDPVAFAGECEAFSEGFRESYEVHHTAPRCLLRLHEEANGGDLDGAGIQAWLEWEWEAMRWGVPVEIAREDLEGLVERSTVLLEREKHRLLHGSDWQRWGRRGGLATLRRYGTSWYSALALKRWGKLDAEDLARARVVGRGLPSKDD